MRIIIIYEGKFNLLKLACTEGNENVHKVSWISCGRGLIRSLSKKCLLLLSGLDRRHEFVIGDFVVCSVADGVLVFTIRVECADRLAG